MLKSLVKELISIDNKERDDASFNEAVNNAVTSLHPIMQSAGTVEQKVPEFCDVIDKLDIPCDKTDEARRSYITDTIDKAIEDKKDCNDGECKAADNGQYLIIGEDDSEKISTAINKYIENKDNESKLVLKKFCCGVLKYLKCAADNKPAAASVVALVNNAFYKLTDKPIVPDESANPKASLLAKVTEISKVLI